MTGIFRQIFRKQEQSGGTEYVRVLVAGRYVNLTPEQARRYQELARTENSQPR